MGSDNKKHKVAGRCLCMGGILMFCLVQAFGGRDKGRGSRHKGEKGKWMSVSSEETEEKGSKPQEKGLIWTTGGSPTPESTGKVIRNTHELGEGGAEGS